MHGCVNILTHDCYLSFFSTFLYLSISIPSAISFFPSLHLLYYLNFPCLRYSIFLAISIHLYHNQWKLVKKGKRSEWFTVHGDIANYCCFTCRKLIFVIPANHMWRTYWSLKKVDWLDACIALRVVGVVLVTFLRRWHKISQSSSQWEARADTWRNLPNTADQ